MTENMRKELSKSEVGNSEKAYTRLTSWRTGPWAYWGTEKSREQFVGDHNGVKW